MKTTPYLFALIFIGLFLYFGFNKFELPTFFIFDKTEKVQGTVVETGLTHGIKGRYYQLVTYQYQVGDSMYTDNFKAGNREGLQKVGNRILIEYAVNKPQKNEVIGYYR